MVQKIESNQLMRFFDEQIVYLKQQITFFEKIKSDRELCEINFYIFNENLRKSASYFLSKNDHQEKPKRKIIKT